MLKGDFTDWWNISVFGVIPVLSVALVFFFKRKYLWTAPLISAALSVIVSIAAMPSILSDNEHRNMFFGISLVIHLAVVIALTLLAYAIVFFKNKNK